MNYASPEKLLPLAVAPLGECRLSLARSLLTRIEALKDRLDNFTVVDAQGETVGEIRNLVLYKRQLHLVIVQPDVHQNWRFVLLSSPLVKQISLRDRTIFVHATHIDITYLPRQRSLTQRSTHSASASVLAPANQLPASQSPNTLKAPLLLEHSAMPKVVADAVSASSMERSPDSLDDRHNSHPALSYPVASPAKPVMVRVSDRGV